MACVPASAMVREPAAVDRLARAVCALPFTAEDSWATLATVCCRLAALLLGAACELQVVRRQGLPRMRDQGGVAAYVGHHGGQREHHAIELQAHVRQFIRTLQLHARAQIAMCRPMH